MPHYNMVWGQYERLQSDLVFTKDILFKQSMTVEHHFPIQSFYGILMINKSSHFETLLNLYNSPWQPLSLIYQWIFQIHKMAQ
jgi:hypothetical protein